MAEKQSHTFETMEINSIIAEAHTRTEMPTQQFAAAPHRADGAPAVDAPAGAGMQDDGFVFSEEDVPFAGRGKDPRRKSKKPAVIAVIAVLVALIAGAAGFFIWKNSSAGKPNVAENMIVSGVNVGGMRYEDALAALAPAEQKLADAISVEVVCGEKRITLTKEDFVYRFDTADVLAQAQNSAAGSSGDHEIRLIVADDGYASAVGKVAAAVEVKAQDAKVTAFTPDRQEMFTFADDVAGQQLNRDALLAQLKSLFAAGKLSGSVTAQCEEIKPAVTADDLRQNIRLLSSFTTVSTNSWNGTENMRVSLGACSGSIIEPGSTWSFNACTGDSNLESKGYKPAGVIVQGRYEIGIGGGICQSSTTIYNAGLLCGLEVAERECHYYPSSYVDYGRDATIDYGNIDLKLRNPFAHQIFLKCYLDGDVLHAEFYGLPAEDFDEVRITTAAPTYTRTSFTVKATRTYYLNGAVVRTEALPSSTYSVSDSGSDAAPATEPTSAPSEITPTTPTEEPPSEEPVTEPGTDPVEEPDDTPGTEPDDSGVSGETTPD